MFYAGLFVHLLVIFDRSWYHWSLCQTNWAKYNSKLYMLLGRVFHDYLMTNCALSVDHPKYSYSTTDNCRHLNRCFLWFDNEPLTPIGIVSPEILDISTGTTLFNTIVRNSIRIKLVFVWWLVLWAYNFKTLKIR